MFEGREDGGAEHGSDCKNESCRQKQLRNGVAQQREPTLRCRLIVEPHMRLQNRILEPRSAEQRESREKARGSPNLCCTNSVTTRVPRDQGKCRNRTARPAPHAPSDSRRGCLRGQCTHATLCHQQSSEGVVAW